MNHYPAGCEPALALAAAVCLRSAAATAAARRGGRLTRTSAARRPGCACPGQAVAGKLHSASDPYDGSLIASTDHIVMVTINYRLNASGFLDVPGLFVGASPAVQAKKFCHFPRFGAPAPFGPSSP
jgi:hypothetical protein